jgi:alpha-L-fucosidase
MPTRRDTLKLSAAALGASLAPRWAIVQGHAMPAPTPAQPGLTPDPLPRVAAFERLAFGMFVHWGLYSQWGKGEWVKHMYKIPTDEYMQKIATFTARDFSGRELARLAKRAGMKYITHTSRHHEGFSLYDTRGLSPYDITHTPAKRDLIADFTDGCRAEGIVPMLYCTTLDWTDPRFENDWDAYQQYLRDSVKLLCTQYGKIGGFWFDGNWSKKDADWQEDKLYAVIREHQPDAMIINNTGIGKEGVLGHPEIDSTTFERGRPQPVDRSGWPKHVAGEMCHTLNYHWGIATADFNYLSPAHVIEELCRCRRAGANLLMNVGPTAEGKVPDYESAALTRVGDWIREIGTDALYHGRPTIFAPPSDDAENPNEDFGLLVTKGDGTRECYLYCFSITATADTRVHNTHARGPGRRAFTGVPTQFTKATWMDTGAEAKLERTADTLTLHADPYPYGINTVVRVARLT